MDSVRLFGKCLTSPLLNTTVLGYLAVHPNHQRQGVASLLIESGVHAAELMGLDIFVSGTKAGRVVYHEAGFTLLGEITQDTTELGGDGEFITAFYSKLVKK
jgi:GNAT superfamily N-acetyltransferase